MVFHWRIFLLSRANRLYSIFLHWLEEPGVPRVSGILLSSTRNTGYGSSARYEPCSKTNFLTIYFRWRGGGGAPLPFWGPSQSFGNSLPPLPVSGDLRLLSTNTCWYPLCDLHSSLTVTLWRLDTVNSNTRSSNFISLLPVGYHVTQTILSKYFLEFKGTWTNPTNLVENFKNIFNSRCNFCPEEKKFA